MEEARDMFVRDMPLGWKQKLAFSIAMIHSPQIVFLDEPTGGVDPKTRRNFWEMLEKKRKELLTRNGGKSVTTDYLCSLI